MEILEQLEELVKTCGTAPLYEEMPRKTLTDKGAAGATAAHTIEEIHTPFNIAYTTYTTGSSAFQNPVGVVWEELPARVLAGKKALEMAGIPRGGRVLIAYPPLINVFSREALEEYGVCWDFPKRSERDGFLAALCRRQPDGVIGESSFLRAALEDSKKTELASLIPQNLKVLAAGTPLDMELVQTARSFPGMEVHDLYGCQEFGWLALDGVPLREDIRAVPDGRPGQIQLAVGGLLTGDCFPVKEGGHRLNPRGWILSYGRKRAQEDWETVLTASTARDRETVRRLARTVLRLKAKIVRVPEEIRLGADCTEVRLAPWNGETSLTLRGPEATAYLDDMLAAQVRYQREKKNDPAWLKTR